MKKIIVALLVFAIAGTMIGCNTHNMSAMAQKALGVKEEVTSYHIESNVAKLIGRLEVVYPS